jgi:hypothetical protein
MDSADDDGPMLTEAVPDLVVIVGDEATSTTVAHETEIADDGAFTVARCSCGWRSYARRSRPLARAEAADHKLLHSS